MSSRIIASCAQFGQTRDGQPVKIFALRDAKSGVEARFIELGAAIHSIFVPDANGLLEDIVLGYDAVGDYETNDTYNGVIVGRVAGRTAYAKFTINGESYALSRNSGEHSHHGGVLGISRKLWQGRFIHHSDGSVSVQFNCTSPHLEDGYPGDAHFQVLYTLSPNIDAASPSCTLRVRIESNVTRACPIAPVSHVTFNLNGEQRAENSLVTNHVVSLQAARVAESQSGLLTGRFLDVQGSLDLRLPRRISNSVTFGGYDHVFTNEIDGSTTKAQHACKLTQIATVRVPENGRKLTVRSDQPATVFYTGYYLDGVHGKRSVVYKKYSGLAIECQNHPNAVNLRDFPSIADPVLLPGRIFVSETEYEFSVNPIASF